MFSLSPPSSSSLSGSNFQSCCCHSSSRQCQFCKGKGNWFISSQGWKIQVPSKNNSRTTHVWQLLIPCSKFLYCVFRLNGGKFWLGFYYYYYLRCDSAALEDALCKRVMITPEEVIKRSLDPLSATVSRDGLAKTIYSRLFNWYEDFAALSHYLINYNVFMEKR